MSPYLYLFVMLILVVAMQFFLEYVLSLLGLSTVIINIIVDLVMAIVFTLINFRGREKLKNPDFHKNIAIYFVIFTLITVIFNYIL